VAQVEAVAEALRAIRPGAVRTGYLAGEGTPLADAVAEAVRSGDPVTVATYLLSPGTLADRVAEVGRAAGAAKITSPLGAAPEVITLIRERWLAAAHGASSA
ncbi:MAG TPA: CbiX/SirB N-terminal domain-containing protein, partial [Actinomycetes bacterium]